MKPSTRSQLTIFIFSGLTMFAFQNCSKVAVNDAPPTLNKVSDNVATATDNQGQDVPVNVDPATDLVSADQPQPDPSQDQPKQPDGQSEDPGMQTQVEDPVVLPPTPSSPSDDVESVCGLDLKTIHNVVDLAQFKGQDVSLDLLKGKTLIYSSDPQISLKSLNINAAVGRTILCGCKVDKLNVKKGRLEVYHSEIKEIGSQKGKLISDSSSLLPAGF